MHCKPQGAHRLDGTRCFRMRVTDVGPQRSLRSTVLLAAKLSYVFSLRKITHRAWGGVVVKALRYKSDGPGIDSRWCHPGFFSVVPPTEPCALRSTQPLKVSTGGFSWGKGGRCVWLTTYHPCSAETSRKSGALPNRNPLGHLGLLRETITLL